MTSRRFFAYDPYDYYYTSPYHYPHRYPYYYYQHPASSRSAAKEYFPAGGYDAEPTQQRGPRPRSVSVPVQFVVSESDPQPEPRREELRAPAKKRVRLSEEEAVVSVQAAARGFLARRMVRDVRAVEREAEGVAARVATEAEALRGDERGRVAVGEALMRMLLRLDAVRGAREYRRRVTKKVLALQDAVDALEPRALAAVEMEEANAAEEGQIAPDSPDDAELSVDLEARALAAEEGQTVPESPEDVDHGIDMEARAAVEAPTTETSAEMEVHEARSTGERDAEDADNAMDNGKMVDQTEGEWEMEEESAAASSASAERAEAGEGSAAPEDAERRQEPAEEKKKAEGGGAAEDLDARKVLQMVAALCERSEQQCEVIGALTERVDSLERAVRRVENAERRRRRNKKLKKEGKCAARSCYSDY